MQNKTLQMKRALPTALLVLLLSAAGMRKGYAYDFVVDRIYYNITSNTNPKTVEVTYRNENYNSYSGDIIIPSAVTHNGVTYNVTRIGNSAFESFNYHEITSITLPNSIEEIGDGAFSFCDRITTILIPNSVTYIGGGAFTHCHGLTSITIPESIETIGRLAFQFCTNLTTVNFNATNCTYVNVWIDDCGIFNHCTSFTTLNIGENVQNIPNKAFIGCTALATVNFYAINCTVGSDCFNGCTNLHTLNYCDGVEHIDAKNIIGVNNLTNISIPSSVKSINFIKAYVGADNGCFYGTGWFDNQPNGVLYLDGWCLGYKGNPPTGDLTIQDGTKGICDRAFIGTEIGSISMPFSLNYLGNISFFNCKNLHNISIPNNVISIGKLAFGSCDQIVSISLGSSITTIGDYAFRNCSNLNTIILLNPTPPVLSNDVFQNISPVATIFVPCGSRLAYFSNWNMFEYNNINEDCTSRPVSISSNIIGGTVSPSVSHATMGQEVRITVTPNPGMELSSLTVYNSSNPTQIIPITPVGKTPSIYSFVMPPYGVAVSATFEHGTTYFISISPNISGGIITASTTSATAGEIITLDVHPNSGYELRSLSVCNAMDASQTVALTNNTFIMPAFDVFVSAIFNYTSVDENVGILVSIHPNPTNGIVRIEAECLKHINISNMLGQHIYDGEANGDEFSYDFSKHKLGIYIIRIETTVGVATKRVVVKR